jgi:AraC-like DNA-binding protein
MACLSACRASCLCLEITHPEKNVLAGIQLLRERQPQMPIILMTIEHSEELAVWALRNRLWDYYRLPITAEQFYELCRNINTLPDRKRRAGRSHLRPPLPYGADCPATLNTQAQHAIGQALQLAVGFIESHLDQKIRVMEVADACGLNPLQVRKAFQEAYNLSISKFVRHTRLARARALLTDSQLNISEVSYLTGFSDPAYFSRIFKSTLGLSPSAFRVQSCRATAYCGADDATSGLAGVAGRGPRQTVPLEQPNTTHQAALGN